MGRNKLKIAFIHPDLGIGGAERLVLDAAIALVKEGKHEVLFITNHFDINHAFEELKSDEYPVQVYGDWLPRSILGKFHALCAYIRMIYLTIIYMLFYKGKDKPDVYFVDLIPIAIPILKLFRQKVIYYCHHPDLLASPPGGILKQVYRGPIDFLESNSTALADVILVNSKYTASVFQKTFPKIKQSLQVLYPTVAFSYQQHVQEPTQSIQKLFPEIPTDATMFLSINRFHPAKKLDLAILAMEQLKIALPLQQWNQIYFIMAGGFDPKSTINEQYFAKLKQLTQKKDLEDKIIFIKSPPDDVKANLLQLCDCLVYTPINEHFGIVPLEAMTVCKPVIACNSGGPQETVDHGSNGFLCEPTPESMSHYMIKLLDRPLAKKMGKTGKKVLEAKFSTQIFAKTLNEILLQLTSNQ